MCNDNHLNKQTHSYIPCVHDELVAVRSYTYGLQRLPRSEKRNPTTACRQSAQSAYAIRNGAVRRGAFEVCAAFSCSNGTSSFS